MATFKQGGEGIEDRGIVAATSCRVAEWIHDYIKTLGVKVKQGKGFFSQELSSDTI